MRFLRQLALCKGRIMFTCVWDRSLASACSPPRTGAFPGTTQFALASPLVRVSEGLGFSLVGFMVSSAHGAATLLSPTKTSREALIPFRQLPQTSEGSPTLSI